MQRKWLNLISLLVFCSLVLSLPGMAAAKDAPPPTSPVHPGPQPTSPAEEGIKKPFVAAANKPVNPAAVTLGASGLSFRYLKDFGVNSEPYLVDGLHLNHPGGVFVDSSNNLFITETVGDRVLKFNVTGSNTLSLGHAGIPWAHDDFLGDARNVTVNPANGHIWVTMNPALKEFDAAGNLIQMLPAVNPWETGTDNGHFMYPHGLAFGPGGYMYVVDMDNHRIQIFDVTGAAPAYIATIGTTGIAQADNSGFDHPIRVAFDSTNRMYVVEGLNARVQRCTSASPWNSWSCTTFFGETGVPGNDLTHLENWAGSVDVDASDNIFIGDGNNYRVLKCNTSAVCVVFAGTPGVAGTDNDHFAGIEDVAMDSFGNVYVSDPLNFRVQKLNSAGVYQSTYGVTGVPYLTDTTRIYIPTGVAVATDGSVYVSESGGNRLLKMNAAGARQWSVGQPGVYGNDNAHFGWLSGNPAIDSLGRVYVPDDGNVRVQIYNSNSSYYTTLGTGYGQGNYEFACLGNIAISPVNGDIYVVDRCNQRVQVYTALLVYKATIGVTGVIGSDITHLNYPWGVAVDASGNVYVGDSDNFRVQKCTVVGSGATCVTFAGETGVQGWDFGHFQHPEQLAVDEAGRVYVVDAWNSKVQVYSAAGAYLATIGGNWGTNTSEFPAPRGIAVDTSGNVYVTDVDTHHVQKFARYTPGWQQSNINGFGEQNNDIVLSTTTFGGKLYAGTENGATGGQIWRSSDGSNWSSVMTNGFGDASNIGIDHMIEFNGNLYAGTENYFGTGQTNGGQLWRSADGSNWNNVTPAGFDGSTNSEFLRLAVYGNKLYASTGVFGTAHGPEIWRSATGNSADWTKIEANGFGDNENIGVMSFATFGSNLYAGTYNWPTGGEVWRSANGDAGTWSQVNTDGFGDGGNGVISALQSFGGYLYAATHHAVGEGVQVWRCLLCNGTDWTKVVNNGFGNAEARLIPALEVFNGRLNLVIGNRATGMEIWRTSNGTTWTQTGFGGFGTVNNRVTYYDNAVTAFGTSLYIGTINGGNGGQVWRDTMTTFSDVNKTYWSWSWIERLVAAGVTAGCAITPELRYCPETVVTRGQMAVFLLRGEHGPSYSPPAASGNMFGDVPGSYWAASWIEQLALEGITSGCSGGNFCPDQYVSRAQMAVFLLKAKNGFSYSPPAASNMFGDVPNTYWAASWIEQLAADGITSGCSVSPRLYCPETPVTRAQMAVFLVKAFVLP